MTWSSPAPIPAPCTGAGSETHLDEAADIDDALHQLKLLHESGDADPLTGAPRVPLR
ncbi:MAG: hypothetical protein ACRDYW_02065 [Acidimicrobiales bacterium]